MTKPCPMCKSPQGCSETMILKGVDDFLNALAKLDYLDNAATDEES